MLISFFENTTKEMSREIKEISADRQFAYDVLSINRPNPPFSRIDEKIQSIAQRRFQQRP